MADTSDLPPFAQATAGALGSVVSNTITYPLDLCSARIQTQSRGKDGKAGYTSLRGALEDIVHKHGVQGLYHGLVSDTISNTLSNFLFFYLRGFLMEQMLKRKAAAAGPSAASASGSHGKASSSKASPSLTGVEDLVVGMLAGIGSRFVTTPLSNVTVRHQTSATSTKAKQQAERQDEKGSAKGKQPEPSSDSDDDEGEYGHSPGIVETLQQIMKEDGVTGLWAGFPTAVLLSVTPALTFYLSHVTSRLFVPRSRVDDPPTISIFLTNASANSLATLLLFPLILSKTRLQYRSPSGRKLYRNLADVLRKTVRRKGVAGLYQGLESQLIKGLGGFGVTMVVKARIESLWYTIFLLLRNRARQARLAGSS